MSEMSDNISRVLLPRIGIPLSFFLSFFPLRPIFPARIISINISVVVGVENAIKWKYWPFSCSDLLPQLGNNTSNG